MPWHFELEPVSPRTDDAALLRSLGFTGAVRRTTAANAPPRALRRLYCSILDYRAPENFIFVPRWMMLQLRLLPRDVVDFTWCKVRAARFRERARARSRVPSRNVLPPNL